MKKMKLLFFLLLFGLPSAFLEAQIVELTESFEDHSSSCLEFSDGCIPGWFNTHGTASVEENAAFGNLSPVTGNFLAHLYVTKNNNCLNSGNSADRGEGMALNFNFLAGEAYQISYHLSGQVGELTWYLSNDLVADSGVPTSCMTPGTAVPLVPAGSQAITPSQISFDHFGDWVDLETDWFTPSTNYSQLWFRASNLNIPEPILTTFVHLDQVIIRRKGECETSCPPAFTDLTACPEEEQFGFISFDCEATYLWDIPAGSTAIEATSSTHSSLLQVSPGTYHVTVTDEKGCEAYHEFIVKEDCCEILEPCFPPEKLQCDYNTGGVVLDWAPVPGALGYLIEVIFNDDDCGCGTGGSTTTVSELVIDPTYFVTDFYLDLYNKCFSWRVRTVCSEQEESEPSISMCFDGGQGCFKKDGFKQGEASQRSATNAVAKAIQAQVHPNPVTADFNFTIALPVSSALTINVFDVNGKGIYQFQEGFVPAGIYQKNWSPDRDLADGIYFVQFHTDAASISEMVLVKRGN